MHPAMGSADPMRPQEGMNSYSQGDLQRMIRQVSDLYTQTAEATAKELEDASSLSESGGENFKVCRPNARSSTTFASNTHSELECCIVAGGNQGQTSSAQGVTWLQTF